MLDISFLKNDKVLEIDNDTLYLNKGDIFNIVILSDQSLRGVLLIDNNEPLILNINTEKPFIIEVIYNSDEAYSIKNFFRLSLLKQENNELVSVYNKTFFVFDKNSNMKKYIDYLNKPFTCKHCGYSVDGKWLFCPNCGAKI